MPNHTSPWFVGLPNNSSARNDPVKYASSKAYIPKEMTSNLLLSSYPQHPSFVGGLLNIHRPICLVLASRAAEAACQRNALRTVDLFHPFANCASVTIQPQSGGQTRTIKNFGVHFCTLYDLVPPQSRSAIIEKIHSRLDYWSEKGGTVQYHKKPDLPSFVQQDSSSTASSNTSSPTSQTPNKTPLFIDKVKIVSKKNIPKFQASMINPTPWFTDSIEIINNNLRFSQIERFSEPIACILVISSSNPDPEGTFRKMYNQHQPPKQFQNLNYNPELLRFFMIIHDCSTSPKPQNVPSLEVAQSRYKRVQTAFGVSKSFFLKINDRKIESDTKPFHPPTYFMQHLTFLEQKRMKKRFFNLICNFHKIPTDTDNPAPKITDDQFYAWAEHYVGLRLSTNALSSIRDVTQTVSNHIASHMSQQIRFLDDTIAKSRRSFQNRFRQLWSGRKSGDSQSSGIQSKKTKAAKAIKKKLGRKSEDPSLDSVHSSSIEQSSSSKRSSTVITSSEPLYISKFTYQSDPMKIRRLADFSFLLQCFDIAIEAYKLLYNEYSIESSPEHYAAAQERVALCSFFLNGAPSSVSFPDFAGNNPFPIERVSKYLNPSITSTFSRTLDTTWPRSPWYTNSDLKESGLSFHKLRSSLIFADCYLVSGHLNEAASTLVNATHQLEDILAAQLLERAAYLVLITGSFRRYCLFLSMAGHRYFKAKYYTLAARCNHAAISLISNRNWVKIYDHLLFKLAKCAANIDEIGFALFYSINLIGQLDERDQDFDYIPKIDTGMINLWKSQRGSSSIFGKIFSPSIYDYLSSLRLASQSSSFQNARFVEYQTFLKQFIQGKQSDHVHSLVPKQLWLNLPTFHSSSVTISSFDNVLNDVQPADLNPLYSHRFIGALSCSLKPDSGKSSPSSGSDVSRAPSSTPLPISLVQGETLFLDIQAFNPLKCPIRLTNLRLEIESEQNLDIFIHTSQSNFTGASYSPSLAHRSENSRISKSSSQPTSNYKQPKLLARLENTVPVGHPTKPDIILSSFKCKLPSSDHRRFRFKLSAQVNCTFSIVGIVGSIQNCIPLHVKFPKPYQINVVPSQPLLQLSIVNIYPYLSLGQSTEMEMKIINHGTHLAKNIQFHISHPSFFYPISPLKTVTPGRNIIVGSDVSSSESVDRRKFTAEPVSSHWMLDPSVVIVPQSEYVLKIGCIASLLGSFTCQITAAYCGPDEIRPYPLKTSLEEERNQQESSTLCRFRISSQTLPIRVFRSLETNISIIQGGLGPIGVPQHLRDYVIRCYFINHHPRNSLTINSAGLFSHNFSLQPLSISSPDDLTLVPGESLSLYFKLKSDFLDSTDSDQNDNENSNKSLQSTVTTPLQSFQLQRLDLAIRGLTTSSWYQSICSFGSVNSSSRPPSSINMFHFDRNFAVYDYKKLLVTKNPLHMFFHWTSQCSTNVQGKIVDILGWEIASTTFLPPGTTSLAVPGLRSLSSLVQGSKLSSFQKQSHQFLPFGYLSQVTSVSATRNQVLADASYAAKQLREEKFGISNDLTLFLSHIPQVPEYLITPLQWTTNGDDNYCLSNVQGHPWIRVGFKISSRIKHDWKTNPICTVPLTIFLMNSSVQYGLQFVLNAGHSLPSEVLSLDSSASCPVFFSSYTKVHHPFLAPNSMTSYNFMLNISQKCQIRLNPRISLSFREWECSKLPDQPYYTPTAPVRYIFKVFSIDSPNDTIITIS